MSFNLPVNDFLGALGSDLSSDGKKNSGVAAILDTKTKALPNIIQAFRQGRVDTVGYDDPTYFGFAIDIHSQAAEANAIINPYTGLRSSPLFYLPTWAKMPKDGSGIMPSNVSGKEYKDLTKHASEACAVQYLNSYSLKLDDTPDEYESDFVPLRSKSKEGRTRPSGALNRSYYLMEFIKILNYIQEKTPWVLKELDGIPGLWKATQAGYDYSPIELTITGDETVDLRLTRLAETYRMLSYDSFNGRKILPPNLEKFSMDIYFMDLRFLRNAQNAGINLIGGSSAQYDEAFSAQVNFGGIAFRCMGCRFDFSNFLEQSAAAKASIGDSSGFQPKFKIIVDRVMPSSYFGDKAFGTGKLDGELVDLSGVYGNAFGGALNLGPFTGGVNRVLSAGRRALTNILGAPQRALNDALLGVQRRFESGVDNLLGSGPLNSRPFEKKSVENLLNERKSPVPINNDVFPGRDGRGILPIKKDVFPGADNRKVNPIKTDVFPGADNRGKLPIKNDVFPGKSTQPTGKLSRDMFPGDVPIMNLINQRKSGGKITSQNPFKK